ncbi:MAG: hypothetical protein J0L75_19675 [Spirochaetes bacterium]|nr:hypothetical protein [Spirochaetota bacterium]
MAIRFPLALAIYGLFAMAQGAEARYGVVLVEAPSPPPARLRIVAVRAGEKAELTLRVGRNLLPIGTWVLSASRGGPEEWTSTITLAGGEDVRAMIEFPEAGWNLDIRARKPGWDLYRGTRRLLLARESRVLLTNLSPGDGEWMLRDGSGRFAWAEFEGESGRTLVWHPAWRHPVWTPIACGLAGLVPGANYFIHFPSRGAGFIFATALVFHVTGVALALSATQELRELSTTTTHIPSETLLGVMIASAAVHGFLSWAGARADLRELDSRVAGGVSWFPGEPLRATLAFRF